MDDRRFQLPLRPFLFSLEQDDDPSSHPDLFGQMAAVNTLHDLCVAALREKSNQTTIALLGRYGQGKTTVLNRSRHKLPHKSGGLQVKCGDFDIAEFRPELLGYEFDRLVSEWTVKTKIVIGGVLLLVWAVLSFIGLGVAWASASAFLCGAVLGPRIWAFLSEEHLSRRLETALRLGCVGEMRRLITAVAMGKPDVLFIDNLDRATVDQQRAFLRSLRRHRSRLPQVVIVAFDETPLTLSDASPEAPQELLAKTFTTAVRLYPMTEHDVAVFVKHVYKQLKPVFTGPKRAFLAFLRHPSVGGDLARILYLHRRHSVRFCYQFLNIVLTAALTLDIDHPADFSALMRLHGLFEFLPWLRHDPAVLADMLANNDAGAMTAYAADILGKDRLSTDLAGGVERYLVATNHMQPYFAGWHTFTGRFGLATSAGTRVCPESYVWFPRLPTGMTTEKQEDEESELRWGDWVVFDLKTVSEADSARRRTIYQEQIKEFQQQRSLAFELSFLVYRLWLADGDARDPRGVARDQTTNEIELLPDFGADDQPLSLSPEELNPLLQITRAAPVATIPFFESVVASSSFRSGELSRPSGEERHRLNCLEARGGERLPGALPLIAGMRLRPQARAAHVVAVLNPLEVPARAAGFDWPKIKRRVDLLGRLDRADSNTLMVIEDFIEGSVSRYADDMSVIAELLAVMASAFPAFEAASDGKWLRRTFDAFIPLAETLFVSGEAALDGIGCLENFLTARSRPTWF